MSKNWKEDVVINVEETGAITRKVTLTFAEEVVTAMINNAARIVGKDAVVPGFRQGKAPAGMIKTRYAEYVQKESFRLFYEYVENMLQTSDKLKDLRMVYVGAPNNMPEKFVEGNAFNVDFEIEITPEIELPDYSSYGMGAITEAAVDQDALDKMILVQKERFGTFEDLKEGVAAVANDLLNVSYTSDLEVAEDADEVTKRLANNANTWIGLSEPEQMPGAIAALTGATVGSEVSFSATYPEDWREQYLQGKTVNYSVKVLGGQHRGEPISDDELAKKLEFADKDAMVEAFRKRLQSEAEGNVMSNIVDAIQDELLQNTPEFPLPESLMKKAKENEFTLLLQGKTEDEKKTMMDEREKYDEEVTSKASASVRKQLIVSKIADKEGVTISGDDIYEELSHISQYTGIEINKLVQVLRQSDRMSDLSMEILIGKTLYHLAKKLMDANKPAEEAK